jgi:type VI secretion system protein ImpC
MIHEMTKQYTTAGADPRQAELIAKTDGVIADTMRELLHSAPFQAMESAWRGMFFLTRRLDTGEDLKIYLIDLPKSEISGLRRVAGGEEWALILGLYEFGEQDEDALLEAATVARIAGAPFIAGLAPEIAGVVRAFENLRQSSFARWVGLAMPRFMLRLPFGAKTDETETFAFEEMPSPPEHSRYLWGNPAIACGYLLGEAFSRYGWQFRPGAVPEIEGLPAHVYQADGESELKACAEVLLTEEAAGVLIERGFIPLASIKGTDRVRVVRFQSVAGSPLAGRWT